MMNFWKSLIFSEASIKKVYKDKTAEEKAVVNEFEGEKEYSKVISNKEYYIFDGNNLNLLEDKTA